MAAEEKHVRLDRWLKNISRWDAEFVALGGSAVLLGWLFENEFLKRMLPGLVAMNPITALGFIFAGVSLLCFWRSEQTRLLALYRGRFLAGILILIGGLKLAAYVTGWQLSFDQVLFGNQIRSDPANFKNQIAPNTAFNFLLTGIILWLLNSRGKGFSRWAQNLSLLLAFVSLIPLVGYIYRASYLYSIGSYIPMALHTCIFFYLLAHGLLLAQPNYGVVALFTGKTPGGVIARRLLPFAFVVPVVLGALAIWGMKTAYYPSELGVTIVVVGSTAVLTMLIWRNARLLNQSDSLRREAETQLRRAHDELEVRVAERTAMLNETNQKLHVQISHLQQAQDKICEQADLLNKARDAIMVLDRECRLTFWNHGAEQLYGWERDDTLGKNAEKFIFQDVNSFSKRHEQVLRDGSWAGELQQTTKAGRAIIVESRWTLVKYESGEPKCILIINTDITEKKNYETHLLRSQRMQSLGSLAGGIAHDLNNALAPVMIGAQLLRQSCDEEERLKLLDMISTSVQRGGDMVKQILSFARGSSGQRGPVPLVQLIKEMMKIIRDTFPKSISISFEPGDCLKNIQGDVTGLHQVLLNLCVNARDAMPNGGRLTLRAENVKLDGEIIGGTAVPSGYYVLLAVADSGTGIPPHVLPRIFEPFFTTKAPDKGTGLGLSTVASIVKHHGGFIQIQSEIGTGTEFKIYLPAAESTEITKPASSQTELPIGRGELILVMDDEEAVRELVKTTLENYGYRVLTAPNGMQGIARFEEHKSEIRLLVTDTDMPFMDGVTAISAIQRARPDLPIIIASGIKRDADQLPGIDKKHLTTLSKPYTVDQLVIGVANAIHDAKQNPT